MIKKYFKSEFRVAIVYLIFGIIWIYVSDQLLALLFKDPILLTKVQNYKGWIFVTASAFLIYFLFRHYMISQRRVQNSLQESEEKFRVVFESSNVGKSITSMNGEISVNQAFASMLGYTREELINKTWQSVTPQEDVVSIQAILERMLADGKNDARFRKRYIHKNGSIIWADVSVALRRDQTGKPLHYISTIVDITDRKKAEDALQHSHDLMRYIIEHNRSAVAVHDKDLNYIYVSQRYLDEYNVQEKDIIGKHHYEVFPDLPQKWRNVHQRALAGEVISAEDDPYFRADGSVEWTRWECRPWYEADGTIGGIIVYTEVITRRKQMEQALRESEERLRLAVEGSQQGIYDLNIQTGKVIVNDIYVKMLGYEPKNFEETLDSWLERMHPEDIEFNRKYFQDYIKGLTENFQTEYRMQTASGEFIWLLSIGKIVEYDAVGRPLRMLGMHTDITKLKQLAVEKDLLSNLFDSALNEIYLFNAQTLLFRQVNQAALRNLGYSSLEIMEMGPFDIFPQLSQADFENLILPLRSGAKDRIIFESVHRRKDGTRYPVEVHLQLLSIEKDQVFAAIVLDVSERKRNENALRAERERLAGIIEGTNVGTWEWDITTGNILINQRWAEIIGYSLEELLPTTLETWFSFVHPEDRILSDHLIQKHFSHQLDYYEVEVRMRHKEGRWVWVLDRGKVTQWSADGKPILMQGTHQDITERKQNEARINEQLSELRRWHEITLGREERIIELKREINMLLEKSGLPPRYTSTST